MAARLKAAGFPDSDLHPYAAPDHPKEGGLDYRSIPAAAIPDSGNTAARLHRSWLKRSARTGPAILSKLQSRKTDSAPQPTLQFHSMTRPRQPSGSTPWSDTKPENYRPRRTLKVALTCGEETAGAFNGANWLTRNRRDLIDAGFALNEGAAGELDAKGNRVSMDVEAGEKFPQNYRLEVTNKGGHSSRPVKDNAIYRLAAAITRISAYELPAPSSSTVIALISPAWRRSPTAKGDTETAQAMTWHS